MARAARHIAASGDRQAGSGADRRTGGHAAGVVPGALRVKAAPARIIIRITYTFRRNIDQVTPKV